MKRILSFFAGGDEPRPSQIVKAVKAVTQPHGDPAVRMSAADRLKAWGTPEAISGLLRRFTIQTPSGAVDLEECQQVEEMLVSLGPAAVGPILKFLERESSVAYPARALEKILPRDEYVRRILDVLETLAPDFGSHNEQRADLVRALAELDDPRIPQVVGRFLQDPDDDVAIAAIACLVRTGDAAHRPTLVETLGRTRDRPRVQLEVAEQLVRLGWPMEEERKSVEASLPQGFYLDKKGRVVGR